MTFKTLINSTTAIALGAAMSVAVAGTAKAEFPDKPIKLYVGFSAGGGTDTTARGFASYVHEVPEMNGMPMVVVNRPGGSGMQAAKIVRDAKPDGYTLHIINIGTFAVADMAKKDSPVNPRTEFTPIGCMTRLVTSLFVHASTPYKDAAAWLKDAKASGKTIKWGTSGAATLHALVGHLMLDSWGIKHQVVPFKGGSTARAAMIAQKTDIMFNGVHNAKGFENDLRTIGVPLNERDPANKHVPTFKEAGLPGIDVDGPMCVWGPKGMPADVVAKLSAAVKAVTGMKGFDRFMKQSALAPIYVSPEDELAKLNKLYDVLGPVVEKVGLRK
ncbi:MAG: tripartite tricarboxylate transporter substrate binding protein [Rhodospirillaceae bacterium]